MYFEKRKTGNPIEMEYFKDKMTEKDYDQFCINVMLSSDNDWR
jgi:hypothetical protein